VTVSGKVPATGMVYVTIHLDYGLKRTGSWKLTGTSTLNPVSNLAMPDVNNASGFGSGPVTILGYQPYSFARSVGSDVAPTTPSSYNEIKKFAGFLGFVTDTGTGKPLGNVKITIYDPANKLLTTQYTDADGYYMYAYKHTAKSATYTVKVPAYNKAAAMTVKANGFAAVDFEVQALAGALAQDGGDEVLTDLLYLPMIKP
jgi:5-hydroxyisourate hydrolase-like protein (transthyretin family)